MIKDRHSGKCYKFSDVPFYPLDKVVEFDILDKVWIPYHLKKWDYFIQLLLEQHRGAW